MEKQKVIVYVDGFNFYYGLRKMRKQFRACPRIIAST